MCCCPKVFAVRQQAQARPVLRHGVPGAQPSVVYALLRIPAVSGSAAFSCGAIGLRSPWRISPGAMECGRLPCGPACSAAGSSNTVKPFFFTDSILLLVDINEKIHCFRRLGRVAQKAQGSRTRS